MSTVVGFYIVILHVALTKVNFFIGMHIGEQVFFLDLDINQVFYYFHAEAVLQMETYTYAPGLADGIPKPFPRRLLGVIDVSSGVKIKRSYAENQSMSPHW